MIHIVTTLMMIPVAYLLGAFVAADFDIRAWGHDGRFAVALIAVLLAAAWGFSPMWWRK